MELFTKQGNALVWQYDGEKLVIEAWGANSLRVRSAMMGDVEDARYALLAPEQCDTQITVGEKQAKIVNGNITAIIEETHQHVAGRLSFYNQKGELLLREVQYPQALSIRARNFAPIIGGNHKLSMVFESDPDEKLYGMGQYQQEILDIKFCNFELAHRNSQASVPFVLSSLGYGFLWHNPSIGRVSFGKNTSEWYAESTKQLDYWITAGDTPAEIVEAYSEATGKVPMMPEYGLGFWQCKLRYYSQKELLEVAREYKRRELPIDVIVCDFFHWPKMGDFRFADEFFPDPQAMVDELHSMGIELMVSVWPTIDVQSENFEEMKQKGYLIKAENGVPLSMVFGGNSLFFDPTNPGAREYVWRKCRENYHDLGVKIFWLDVAEPEYTTYDFANYRYHGGPNAQIGNTYPAEYSRAFFEGMVKAGQKNIVNLVRCAWAGSQRYGALVWSGDIDSNYEDFRKQICAGLHMGIAGIPWWTTDIGGFNGGDPEDEGFRKLLVRWFQYGTFCPVMRLHGNRLPFTPLTYPDGREALFTGGPNEVWSCGEEVYDILRKYMLLREKMRPYVRSLMEEAHAKGTPVIRTMFYEFPDDENCWDLKDQYMFGGDILVAPIVYENMYERSVYLPRGSRWTCARDGEIHEGGRTVSCEAPLDVIPVFFRDCRQGELADHM